MAEVECNKLVQSQVHFIRTTEVENSDGNLENVQIITTNAFTEDSIEMNTTSVMISIIVWSTPSPVTPGSLALSRFYL
jgi:hypothetical protein